ncbi:MAG: LysM peptidoglycan-binding domain-containing protein [Firmicutes bacterium]|nr:LysM peptidoglycan-binding domain-containing protein [Bacillota bacterium]
MKTWYVQPGDTLYQIAQSHSVSISDLLAANPGLDPNNLIVGQEVMIPDKGGTRSDSPQCPSGIFWVVAPGDTLYSIAQATGVNLDDLIAVNPHVDPFNLLVGQELCLPPSGAIVPPEIPPCPSGLFWVVEPGDTLYKISQATGFTVDEILAVNPGLDPDNLQPRTNICLPQGGLLL